MPRFVLKVLTTDVAERRRQRLCAVATITVKGDRMVIAVGKGEPRVIANYKDRWFHISLGCVLGVCWIQKFFWSETSIAMFVPTAAKKSHRVPDQALTFPDSKPPTSDCFASGISSSRFRDMLRRNRLRMEVAATLLRLCRCAGSLAPTNLRALPQFDDSTADQSRSHRALS